MFNKLYFPSNYKNANDPAKIFCDPNDAVNHIVISSTSSIDSSVDLAFPPAICSAIST